MSNIDDDPLAPARGILNGVLISLPFWLVVLWLATSWVNLPPWRYPPGAYQAFTAGYPRR